MLLLALLRAQSRGRQAALALSAAGTMYFAYQKLAGGERNDQEEVEMQKRYAPETHIRVERAASRRVVANIRTSAATHFGRSAHSPLDASW
jgi:hypothetical protein